MTGLVEKVGLCAGPISTLGHRELEEETQVTCHRTEMKGGTSCVCSEESESCRKFHFPENSGRTGLAQSGITQTRSESVLTLQ